MEWTEVADLGDAVLSARSGGASANWKKAVRKIIRRRELEDYFGTGQLRKYDLHQSYQIDDDWIGSSIQVCALASSVV